MHIVVCHWFRVLGMFNWNHSNIDFLCRWSMQQARVLGAGQKSVHRPHLYYILRCEHIAHQQVSTLGFSRDGGG